MRFSKVGIVPSQGVELFSSRVLVSSVASRLPKAGSDFIEGPALRLWQLEVGEDEEAEQQHSEDDEDVRATELLTGEYGTRYETSSHIMMM